MNNAHPPEQVRTIFLIPVFNDWQALELLVQKLDDVLTPSALPATLVILDDGSTTSEDADGCNWTRGSSTCKYLLTTN